METIITKRKPTVTQVDVKKYPLILAYYPSYITKFRPDMPKRYHRGGDALLYEIEKSSSDKEKFNLCVYDAKIGGYDEIHGFKNVVEWVKQNAKKPRNTILTYTDLTLQELVKKINWFLQFNHSDETFVCLYNPYNTRKVIRKYEYSVDSTKRIMNDPKLLKKHQNYMKWKQDRYEKSNVSLESNRMNNRKKSPVKKNVPRSGYKNMVGDIKGLGKNLQKLI